ncbi:hypothetical protein [Streptomyces sp. NPDC059176]|uniref:hypothetical protein n=1 Tax=unclassified Streptomyces TaxID=2593676 RepID=UPI0036AD43E4
MTGTTARAGAATRYDRWMHGLMNRREGDALHATVSRRRAFVGGHIALTAAAVAAWLGAVVGDRLWCAYALAVLVLPWCIAMGVINASTRGLLELRARVLDERQLAERAAVRARAHTLTTWLVSGATVGAGAIAWVGDVATDVTLFTVLFVVLIVHWTMPRWVAGLSVRDEPADDPGIE